MNRICARIFTIALVLCVLWPLSGCSTDANSSKSSGSSSYRQIDAAEAVQIMAEEDEYIILDVRTEQEFAQGHIPGAINVPVETIGTECPPELPDKDQLILVYCRSGNRSKTASEALAKLGYSNIVEFGGIVDWPGDIVAG